MENLKIILGLGGPAENDGKRERAGTRLSLLSFSLGLPPRNLYGQSSTKEASAEERGPCSAFNLLCVSVCKRQPLLYISLRSLSHEPY